MGIDLENFGVGLATGWGSAYLLYRSRKALKSAADSVREGAQKAQNSATRSADSRFVNDLVALCQTQHLAAAQVDLTEVLVEPQFLAAPALTSPSEDHATNVLKIVPQVHDHPYLHSVYGMDTLTIDDLAAGHRAITILGDEGSGRTTALMAIALQSLGKASFKPPFDTIQDTLNKEEAELSEKQRAVRIKERVLMEQRARERLATEKGISWDAKVDDELKNDIPLFNRLMPLYVHMSNLNLSTTTQEFGTEVDPAEPIIRAVQYSVGRVTASTIPRYLYARLNEGQVLLLIDGFDDLSDVERPLALAWFKALLAQYGNNFIIITAPATGFDGLTSLGFTPVFLRPWSDLDTRVCAHKWAESWDKISKKRRAAKPDAEAILRARANSRGFNPFEIVVKTWTNYAEDAERPAFDGWVNAFLARQITLGKDMTLAQILPNLSRLAALQLDEGYITIQRLQALHISGEAFGIKDTQSIEQAEATETAPEAAKGDEKDKKEADVETTTSQGRLLGLLRNSGLLIRYRGNRYQFRHPLIAAYLAGLLLKDLNRETVKAKFTNPNWRNAFTYAVAHTNFDHLVKDRLTAPADVLNSSVFDIARWAAFAPPDAAWRGAIFKILNDILVSPSQFSLIRERAAAALLDTRDTKNVSYIFRRAVRNLSPEVRKLAALGMGATGDEETAKDLAPLLDDQATEVRIAASIALGAIGTQEALEEMVIAFTENQEPVRQAIAEQLALLPDEGHPVLFDAIKEPEDMTMRRAAVFGLRRTRTVWGLIEIYRTFLEDEQWYVRSAAQNAFEELQFGRVVIPSQKRPEVDQIEWLGEWAAEKGENLPTGEGAKDMLLRALVEGDTGVRMLAAQNIGQVGNALMIKPLYSALRDKQEGVRLAAYNALGDIQLRLGKPLPSPV